MLTFSSPLVISLVIDLLNTSLVTNVTVDIPYPLHRHAYES